MEVNFNFLSICLDTANCILKEELIYKSDFDYISIVFKLCKDFISTYSKSDESILLYSKMLDVQKNICNRYNSLEQ